MASFSILFRLFTSFLFVFSYAIWPIISCFNKEKKKTVPSTSDEIFTYSATEIARKIRTKQITCEVVVTKFIGRIKIVNPIVNALVEDRFEKAIKDAKEKDKFLNTTKQNEEDLEKEMPLFGVPMTIKESISIKGMSLAVGSKTRLGVKAQEDAEVITKIKDAGAIPLCVTNTPEFCLSIETNNFVTGITNNPYNTLHNCGGSSGGEGAIIGSGASVCGLGSDIAGSIRIPAAFNGIFGHKPSAGIVDLQGHFPLSVDSRCTEQLTIGPMTRYAEDLALITKVLAGPKADELRLDEPVDLATLKVVFMEDCGSTFGILKVQKEIKAGILAAVKHLEICNANISDVKFEELKYSTEIAMKLHFSITGTPYVLNKKNVKLEVIKSLFGKSMFPFNTILYGLAKDNSGLIFMSAQECDNAVKEINENIVKELGNNGVLIYPSFPTSAIPHWGSLYATIGASYLGIFNVLGLPATSVPIGFDAAGLPIGIQIVAAPKQDRLCFAVAKELESFFGGWKEPY